MKNITKNQHIVPKSLIRRWCFNEKHRRDSVFYMMNQNRIMSLEKLGNYKSVFVQTYFFEYDKNEVTNKIERELSKIESAYACFVERIINKNIKFINGEVHVEETEKGMLFIFSQIQSLRVSLVGVNLNQRNKILRKIEEFLKFYNLEFCQLSNDKIQEKIKNSLSRLEIGQKKFKNSNKKLSSFITNFLNEPRNIVFFKLIDPNYKLLIRYYSLPIWPLPLFGPLTSLLGTKKANYKVWIWPISPQIVFCILSFSFDFILLNRDFVYKDFSKRFDDVEYLINDFLPGALLTYLFHIKLPLILSKYFVMKSWMGQIDIDISIKKRMRNIILEQLALEREDNNFKKQSKIKKRREVKKCLKLIKN